jgi:tetratricopeptide (TPR) repeat protein
MAKYLDVLVLCSDPVNFRHTLNLAQELVHFEHVIRGSELPIRLRRVVPPTLDQLQKEFAKGATLGRQPSVFHFLGHGDDDGLYFENEHGEFHLIKGHELRQVLAPSPVNLVLLNACWSATKRGVSLCDFLTREQVARAAIGHERPVADASAIEFARQFYALITQGRSVREACLRAANSLAEQGQPGAAEVKLVGDGQFQLTDGLPAGLRPSVVDAGLPRHGHLPDAGVFYGRGDELVGISHALADARVAGFGLWGIGGIGKTALAKASARRNAWRYQGAVWVDIRDATQKTTAELLRLALCRLHPGAPDADPGSELTRRLQDAPSLIVLDNLEDLPESEHAALARFIQQTPRNGSHVLLTARVPLPAVERLPGVRSRRMTEGLDPWNGAHYVRHVARQKQCLALQDELREENGKLKGLCVQVTQRLHGHPKMLELAVGVALQGRPALEQALVALPDDLEQQLAAMLATSLSCLGSDGRRVLPLLGFFPTGSLTPEALEVAGNVVAAFGADLPALGAGLPTPTEPPTAGLPETDAILACGRPSVDAPCGVGDPRTTSTTSDPRTTEDDDEPDVSWLARGREQLVAAGLLDYGQARDVYTFHQAIVDEAYRRRPGDDVEAAVTAALLRHFAEYVRANHADNARLDRCAETALVLMESVWSGRDGDSPVDAVLADMTGALGNYLRERGLWRLGEQWHERAIELRRSSSHARNDVALATQLFQHGQVLAGHAQPDAARKALDEALRLYEQASDRRGIGCALHELARIESAQGNPSEARRLLQRSLAIKESLGDRRELSASLHELAMIESDQGNPSEARRLLQRSLAIFESLGDQLGLSASLHQLAIVESAQGNPSEARRLLQRSLAIKESLGDQRGLAASLHQLAMIESAQGNPSEARRLLQRSLAILESLGDQRGLAASLHQLASIESAQGNPSEARRLLLRSLAILESLGDQRGLAASLHQLATIEITAGDRNAARQLWDRSIRIEESIGNVAGVAVTRGMLAQLDAVEGRFERAIELATDAVRQLEQLGYAQAEQARGVLRNIEEFAAQRGASGSPASSLSARLHQTIAAWQSLSPAEQADRLASSNGTAADPVEVVLSWLAHSAVCWQRKNVAGCDAALTQAQMRADASGDAELLALVDALRKQRAAASPSGDAGLGEKLGSALKFLEQGNLPAAVPLLEQALAAARAAAEPLAVATCQFYLGQVRLMSGRAADAVPALRESLELATQAGESGLIRAVQEVLTVAIRAGKGR